MVVHFERKDAGSAAKLGEIVEGCLEIAGAEALGIVMIAESAGLIGTALRRSPALRDSETALFAFPQVRDWLSFAAEPVYTRALTLVAGIAAGKRRHCWCPCFVRWDNLHWPVTFMLRHFLIAR